MSYNEFWNERPELVKAYKKAHELNMRRTNEELWLQGIYMRHALASVVDGKKNPYPVEPLAITQQESEAKKEREAKARYEKMKAKMKMATKTINRKGGVNDNGVNKN